MKNLVFLILSIFCVSCATKQKISHRKMSKIFFKKGTQELISKDYTSALASLIKANEYDPNNDEIINNLGMAYYFKKNKTLAIKHLNQAIEVNPQNIDAITNLATIYMNQGQLEHAKKVYQKTLEENLTYKNSFRVYYNLGLIEQKQGHFEKALKLYKQSISENDAYCPPHFKLAEVAKSQRNYQAALDHYKAAATGSCQSQPNVHYEQAMAHLKLKQFDSAKFKLQEILNRFPKSKERNMAQAKLESFEALKLSEQRRSF